MQCARAFHDTGHYQHVLNGVKYALSIYVGYLSLYYGRTSRVWLILALLSALYSFAWDILVDWGHGPAWLRRILDGDRIARLYQKRHWGLLRPHAVVNRRNSCAAIGFDFLARMSWAIYVAPGKVVAMQHVIRELALFEPHTQPSHASRPFHTLRVALRLSDAFILAVFAQYSGDSSSCSAAQSGPTFVSSGRRSRFGSLLMPRARQRPRLCIV
jgi:hypothetical protein